MSGQYGWLHPNPACRHSNCPAERCEFSGPADHHKVNFCARCGDAHDEDDPAADICVGAADDA